MLDDTLVLCLAAAAGGAINSVAGGGTLLTFPALFSVLGGTSAAAVIANATSTVALWPGSAAAMAGYRRELVATLAWAKWLLLPSLAGGWSGSLLVTRLPPEYFAALVPWLILTATLLLALQRKIAAWTGIGKPRRHVSRHGMIFLAAFQFLVALYGGYFGAGIGILMLGALALYGFSDMHHMNAVKTLLACGINGVAVVVFSCEGRVDWTLAPAMAGAAIVGGYLGARIARRIDGNLVRGGVVVIGFALAAYYFVRLAAGG
jgi:hypothetical protein